MVVWAVRSEPESGENLCEPGRLWPKNFTIARTDLLFPRIRTIFPSLSDEAARSRFVPAYQLETDPVRREEKRQAYIRYVKEATGERKRTTPGLGEAEAPLAETTEQMSFLSS
jgi:hypothetical protein